MAILTTGNTFANGDQVTSTKLNNIANAATFASGSVDDSTTQIASGSIIVKDLGISAGKLAASSVTTVKITDSNVTTAKIAAANITTSLIANSNVTKAKIENLADYKVLGNVSGGAAAPAEVALLDEDNMSSNSATSLATQQSIKAYVDTQLTAEDLDFAGDSGSSSVDLDSQTFTIAGATGLDTAASGQTLTVSLDFNEISNAAIADGDFIPFVDATDSTTKKEAIADIATLFAGTGLSASSSVLSVDASQTQITSVGTLGAGAISSGFGAIDNGSSAITTTGVGSFGSLDISGDVDVDGTLETDALSIASTVVTATAAELNILDGVTSTAAEINLLDGSTANTVVNSKAVVYGSGGQVAVTSLSGVLANGVTATTQSASDNSTKVATTAYVDSQVTAEDLDFAGDGGTGAVDLDSQTLTIAGATGLDTAASGQTLTVSLDLNELATETSIAQDDFVAMVDNTDSGNGKITFSNLEDQVFGNVSGAVAIAAGGAATVGAVTVADESSDTTCFPLFATAATGSLGPKSGSNLTFNSSTGLLTATTLSGILANGVTATTQSDGDNSTKVATTAYVDSATGGGEGGAFTTLTASGDVNFDSGTFFTDASENRVGIGTTAPAEKLHVAGNIMLDNNTALKSKRVAGNAFNLIGINNTGQGWIEIGEASTVPDGMYIYTPTDTGQGVTFHNGTDPLMYVRNDGDVGIGITAPDHRLSVHEDANAARTEIGIDNTDQRLVLGAYFETGVTQYSTIQSTNNAESSGTNLALQPDGGNVGIGTASPSQKLEVTGGILLSTTNQISFYNTGYFVRAYAGLEVQSADYIRFLSDGANEQMRINAAGNVGIGTTSPGVPLHIARSGESSLDIEDTGGQRYRLFARNSDDVFGIYDVTNSDTWLRYTGNSTIGSTKLALLEGGGNVGIGTTTPQHKLDIRAESDAAISTGLLIANTASSSEGTGTAIRMVHSTSQTSNSASTISSERAASNGSIIGLNLSTDGSAVPSRVMTLLGANGNVGIGITSPNSKLTIVGDDEETAAINTATATTLEVAGNGTSSNSGGAVIFSAASGAWKFAAIKGSVVSGTANTVGDLAFSTRNATGDSTLTERMRILYGGNVGIGTAAPAEKLEVAGNVQLDSSNANLLIKQGTGGTTGGMYFTFSSDATKYAGMEFVYETRTTVGPRFYSQNGYDLTVDSGDDLHLQTDSTDRITILNAGNVGIGTTSPDESLDVVGAGRFSTGVTFGTDTAAANKLDDYEEGVWTPTITFGGASAGVVYSTQVGTYTKIGDLVTVTGSFLLSNKGSSTGNAIITGLPFASRSLSGNLTPPSLRIYNISFADFPMGYNNAGLSTIILQESSNAGTVSNLTEGNFSASSQIQVSLSYRV